MKKQTFGVIVGNRGFFPDHLAKSGREEMIQVLEKLGYGVVVLSPEDTKYGAVETRADAKSAPSCSTVTAMKSTASSSPFPTSATSAAWPRRCAAPACVFPCSCRRRRTAPPA